MTTTIPMPTHNDLFQITAKQNHMTSKNYQAVKRRYFANLGITPSPSATPKRIDLTSTNKSFSSFQFSTNNQLQAHSLPTQIHIRKPNQNTFVEQNFPLSPPSPPSVAPKSIEVDTNQLSDDVELDFEFDFDQESVDSEASEPRSDPMPICIDSGEMDSDYEDFVPPHLLVDHSNTFSVFQHRKRLHDNKKAV